MHNVHVEIIETPYFLRKRKKLLSANEYRNMLEVLEYNPVAGDVVSGTEGARKMRLARDGQGKSGGYRVVYFFHTPECPLYLLDVYAKSDQDNLSKAERNAWAAVIRAIKQEVMNQ